MEGMVLKTSLIRDWLFLTPYTVFSYFRSNTPSLENLLEISNQSNFDEEVIQMLNLWNAELSKKSPSFRKVMISHFINQIICLVVLAIIISLMFILESVLIYYLVRYISNDDCSDTEGILLAFGLILNSTLTIFLAAQFFYIARCAFTKAEKLITDILTKKMVRVHCSLITKENIRLKFINVIASDLSCFTRLDAALILPAAVVTYSCAFAVSYIYFSVWGLVGAVISMLHILLLLFLLKKTQSYSGHIMKISDKRVRLVENLIEGIKIVKLNAWEIPYLDKICQAKQEEKSIQAKIISISAFFFIQSNIGTGLIIFISLALHVSLGNELDVSEVFFLVSLFMYIQTAVVTTATHGMRAVSLFLVLFKRVEDLLLLEEFTPRVDSKQEGAQISLVDCTFAWTEKVNSNEESRLLGSAEHFELKALNFEMKDHGLLIVIGLSGSGKSTLLMGLLGELVADSKNCKISGKIGLDAEEPWIISDTAKANIIIGNEYNHEKYMKVISDCALENDFNILPNGEDTVIGDRGITLSGGQKTRLNFARTIYSDSDIYLLDDPLSAVDTRVSSHLFETIKNLSKEKLVVLATHQIHLISQADKILVLDNGHQMFFGSPQELSKSEHLESMLEKIQVNVNNDIVDEEKFSASHAFQPADINKSGVDIASYWKYMMFGFRHAVFLFLAVFALLLAQVSNYSVIFWTVLWLNSGESDSAFYIQGMAIIVVVAYIIYSSTIFTFYHTYLASNLKLHNAAINGLTNTNSKFYDENISGAFISRFTKDISEVDEYMAQILFDIFSLVTLVIVISVAQAVIFPYTLVVLLLWGGLIYIFFNYFNPIVMKLKNIELVVKGPLISLCSSLLSGFATVRSLSLSDHVTNNMKEKALNIYRASYAYNSLISLALLFITFSICLMFFVVIIETVFTKGMLDDSIAAFNLVIATVFLKSTRALVTRITDLQSVMCSIQRLIYFSELKPEGAYSLKPDFKVTHGAIRFVNVCMKYSPECDLALNKLNLSIEPGAKVGVVGRTGAGKSSIMQVLFKLVHLQSGNILIDGVDIASLGLHDLRKQLSVIPQSAFIFYASIRDNLDPTNQYTDEELLKVLDEVSLGYIVEETSQLDSLIIGKDVNLSAGQKQLLCIARAILKKNKIVMMDEATSNIDNETDKEIQKIVRKVFVDCTMIVIAHRLRTVIDSHYIAVMEAGACKEYGKPSELCKDRESLFMKLVLSTGAEESKFLIQAASNQ